MKPARTSEWVAIVETEADLTKNKTIISVAPKYPVYCTALKITGAQRVQYSMIQCTEYMACMRRVPPEKSRGPTRVNHVAPKRRDLLNCETQTQVACLCRMEKQVSSGVEIVNTAVQT